VHVRVVDDTNGNGREDPGERGIAGANVDAGCGDHFFLLTTNANGDAAGAPSHNSLLDHDCYYLQLRFGWFPVSPLSLQVLAPPPPTTAVMFFVHDLGPSVMELHGDVVVRGLPATNVTFSRAAPPFTGKNAGCVESFMQGSAATAIIVGSDQRAGCPSKGDKFSVIMEGQVVATFQFLPGEITPDEFTFVAGGDSMLAAAEHADGAQIDGADCAVVRPMSGGLTSPSNFIYVLSDEARAGCGTPGKLVRFTNGGRPLDPLIEWHAGAQNGGIDFTEALPHIITPPNTGSAGLLPGARAD
jgi:hypothetical protein